MADQSNGLLEQAFHWEKTRPDAVYMTQPLGGGTVDDFSWARTLTEARRMAAHLKSLDLPEKSNIGLVSKNCAHFIMSDLAIWLAGHVSVALYPTVDADTVSYVLEHSGAKLLFVGKLDTWDEMKAGVPEGMPMISYPLSPKVDCPTWNDVIAQHEPIEGEVSRDPDDTAILIYTSGSTGRPKGVMISFRAMASAARGYAEVLDVSQNDRMLSYLPLAHSFERSLVESNSLMSGMRLFFAESLDTFVQDLQRARPTLFISVPRLWLKFQLGVFEKMPPQKLDRLLKIPILSGIIKKKILGGLGLDSVRFAGSGSAPIPAELIAWYRSLGLELLEGYSMSENFAYSHVSYPGKSRVGYVGNTLPHVECKLSDEGEILIKSPTNMQGYYNAPDQTAETFTEDGWLKTGDRGDLDEQQRLRITGRVKEIFKTSKGKYVAPAPIENLINVSPYVELSCVSGSGHPSAIALVQLSEDATAKAKSDAGRAEITEALAGLLKEVNAQLAHHERLGWFAIVPEAWTIENKMLTPTMKIRRSAIEAAYEPRYDEFFASGEKVIWG